MSRVIGIDLGTTYSAVSLVQNGKPAILPKGNERIMPSVVGCQPNQPGSLLIGTPARNQFVLYPEHTVHSIKRKMGTEETVSLHGRAWTPAEVSAVILKELKRVAENHLQEPVNRVVITVPAFFSDAARQATKEAGEMAGFTVERIINEPTAAALAYGLDRAEDNQMVAVYDLGGGTFDVSIIELNQGVIEVLASHGDTHLGGDDFDAALVEHLLTAFEDQHGKDTGIRDNKKAMARLLRAAEAAKITLSEKPYSRVAEEYLLEVAGKPLHLDLEVSRNTFEDLITPLLTKSLASLDQALKDAHLTVKDLEKLILVGGSTRIPLIWEMLANHTGLAPMIEINPDEAVALGAGVQAAIIEGEPIDAVLVDVTPHSIGIEVAQCHGKELLTDCYKPIIHRNTALPTTRSDVFSGLVPEQTQVHVKIYQGEDPIASQNTLLGDFMFSGLKPERKDEPPQFTVQFDMDINGILHVSATDRGSRKVEQTTLQAAHTVLSPAERDASAQYLEGLFGHNPAVQPKEDDDPILSRARKHLGQGPHPVLATLVQRWDESASMLAPDARNAMKEAILDLLFELEEGVSQ